MCVCVCVCFVCVCVCVCVCVKSQQTREILIIRHDLNTKFCFILYQTKTCERQEVKTFRETHINYTREYFHLYHELQWKKANATVSLHNHILYIQHVTWQWSDQNCTAVPKFLTTVDRALNCVVQFKRIALFVELILPCTTKPPTQPQCCGAVQSSVLYIFIWQYGHAHCVNTPRKPS